jgi:hypothetical protein
MVSLPKSAHPTRAQQGVMLVQPGRRDQQLRTTQASSSPGADGGLPLVAPGVVPVAERRPDPGCPPAQPADLYAELATVTGWSR